MERYYSIQDQGDYDFLVGTTRDGRQVLMGLLCPELVVVFFDPEGRFLECEARPWEVPAPRMPGGTPFQIYDREFRESIRAQIQGWHEEIGFEPGPIAVREFFIWDRWLGIKDLPDHLEEFLADPSGAAEDEEEADDLRESINLWLNDGQFVLWWAKDYWMGADGDVDST
jgi:hypothetical protein